MENRLYYEAYDDRYRQVHGQDLRWFAEMPSPIVHQIMEELGLSAGQPILEIGCGEGRDAAYLLNQGYTVLATDVSPAAVEFCRKTYPAHESRFRVLDCLTQRLDERFVFIYAVAVVHMLVEDRHRDGFYRFLRDHLADDGVALVCAMGDGCQNFHSDPKQAFVSGIRTHGATGQQLSLVNTSCRVVDMDTFSAEIQRNGLAIVRLGHTAVEPDFPQMIYALVTK